LLKYIAAQLHKIDVTPIREKLARLQNKSVHVAREHHIVERWRNRLITEGNEALTELLEAYPEADRQQIRQLIRNIQKEQAAAKPPKSFRQLYRYLRELFNFSADFEAEDSSIAAPNEESEI
jgi:ribosome-associated protein